MPRNSVRSLLPIGRNQRVIDQSDTLKVGDIVFLEIEKSHGSGSERSDMTSGHGKSSKVGWECIEESMTRAA
jgi:hypothetical protein